MQSAFRVNYGILATFAAGILQAERADQLLEEGDMAGAETWHRILNAVERLQAKAPAEGKKCIDRHRSAACNPGKL